MAGKTKPKKKQPLDTRSKMYLVLALCSVMLLVCIGISLALIGWLPFGSAAPQSVSTVDSESMVTESGYNKEENTIDTQAAERRGRDRADVLELAVGREAAQVDDPVRHAAADQTDDEFQNKGRDGIARVTGHNVGQRQTDGTGQTAGNAVQQQGGQRREGVAQMKAGPGAQHIRDAEKLIRDKAQRGHDADDADLLHGEFGFCQRCDEQCQSHYDKQQQPDHCGRHDSLLLY